MSSIAFHETVMGQRFIQGTVPTLSKNVEHLVDALQEGKQYPIVVTGSENVEPVIKEEIEKGSRFENLFHLEEKVFLIMFNKKD